MQFFRGGVVLAGPTSFHEGPIFAKKLLLSVNDKITFF